LTTIRASDLKICASITFPPLFFIHYCPFSCLRRTWWDVVRGCLERESKGEPTNPGSPGKIAVKLY